MKRPTQENNYSRQLIGVGVLAALLVFILGAFAVIKIVSAQPRSTSERGTDPASLLASRMERAFPLINILGVNSNRETDNIEVLFYDPAPLDEWSAKEKGQMDEVMFLAMKFAEEQGMGLTIYVLHSSPAVGLDGENVSVLLVNSVLYCYYELFQDVDWSIANHDTIEENCLLLAAGYYWGNADKVTWGLEL